MFAICAAQQITDGIANFNLCVPKTLSELMT